MSERSERATELTLEIVRVLEGKEFAASMAAIGAAAGTVLIRECLSGGHSDEMISLGCMLLREQVEGMIRRELAVIRKELMIHTAHGTAH